MGVTIFRDIVQGSEEWHTVRRGILTASKIDKLVTPTLKLADNEGSRGLLYEIMAERLTGFTEDTFVSYDMMKGHESEIYARQVYSETYAPVEQVGFVTNDKWGFVIGASPDGLVHGKPKGIEVKSHKAKIHLKNIFEADIPREDLIQVQTLMLVLEYPEWDYISYCGGLPMKTMTIAADPSIQDVIVKGAENFEKALEIKMRQYEEMIAGSVKLIPTIRQVTEEISA